jgi:hypothetical protein
MHFDILYMCIQPTVATSAGQHLFNGSYTCFINTFTFLNFFPLSKILMHGGVDEDYPVSVPQKVLYVRVRG